MAHSEPTLADYLVEEQATSLHDLYARANTFLHDYENPQLLHFAHTLGVASVGHEVEGSYYRLTDSFRRSGFHIRVPDLVAVEQVPDEAIAQTSNGQVANDSVGDRLWRLRPARIAYALGSFDDVFPACIEDFANTELEWSWTTQGYDGREAIEHRLPFKNFCNELDDGEQLERAQDIIGELLGKLEV